MEIILRLIFFSSEYLPGFPSCWRIRIPVAGHDLQIAPLVATQELITAGSQASPTGKAPWRQRLIVGPAGHLRRLRRDDRLHRQPGRLVLRSSTHRFVPTIPIPEQIEPLPRAQRRAQPGLCRGPRGDGPGGSEDHQLVEVHAGPEE